MKELPINSTPFYCFLCSWSPLAAFILETQAAAPDIKSPKGEVLLNLLLVTFLNKMDKFLSTLIHFMAIVRRKKLSQTCILKIKTKHTPKKTLKIINIADSLILNKVQFYSLLISLQSIVYLLH